MRTAKAEFFNDMDTLPLKMVNSQKNQFLIVHYHNYISYTKYNIYQKEKLIVNIRKINKGRLRSGSLIFLITSIIKDKIGRHDVLLPINQNYDKVKKETRQQLYVFIKKTAKFPTTARAYTYTRA